MTPSDESTHLGKKVSYPSSYTPDLLVGLPRSENRELYGLKASNLPFTGLDVWHAYEVSFLTNNGMPVAGVLKLTYPARNSYIVESKSLKLYLNSFNMEKLGDTKNEAIQHFLSSVENDLDNCLFTMVKASFIEKDQDCDFDFEGYELLEEIDGIDDVEFTKVKESHELLEVAQYPTNALKLSTHLLRSNCKVTYQPDWGSAYIHIEGEQLPDKAALLQYIVSFRNEHHFHEEVCEMIYKRLWDKYLPAKLMVSCLYTRRGGIDICPVRVSDKSLLPKNLCNHEVLSPKELRQ